MCVSLYVCARVYRYVCDWSLFSKSLPPLLSPVPACSYPDPEQQPRGLWHNPRFTSASRILAIILNREAVAPEGAGVQDGVDLAAPVPPAPHAPQLLPRAGSMTAPGAVTVALHQSLARLAGLLPGACACCVVHGCMRVGPWVRVCSTCAAVGCSVCLRVSLCFARTLAHLFPASQTVGQWPWLVLVDCVLCTLSIVR